MLPSGISGDVAAICVYYNEEILPGCVYIATEKGVTCEILSPFETDVHKSLNFYFHVRNAFRVGLQSFIEVLHGPCVVGLAHVQINVTIQEK